MLTDEELAAMAARAEAATPGPWEFYPGAHGDPRVVEEGRGPFGSVALCSTAPRDYGRATAEFIAAARTDVPALIAEVHRLRGQPTEERPTDERPTETPHIDKVEMLRDRDVLTVVWHDGGGLRKVIQLRQTFPTLVDSMMLTDFASLLRSLSVPAPTEEPVLDIARMFPPDPELMGSPEGDVKGLAELQDAARRRIAEIDAEEPTTSERPKETQ